MSKSNTELATRSEPQPLERADVVAIIMTGDLNRLNDEQKAWYYVHECQRMGLDPAARPLEWAALQGGKLTLYARRVAGDMLAAKHRVSVELTDGPRVLELGTAKVLYARAKATMPDGRHVEDVGTVGANDIVNGVMKVCTKAIRRATLRLCGWGGLDESELETIPGARALRALAADPDRPDARAMMALTGTVPAPSPLDRLRDELQSAETFDQVVQCYRDNVPDLARASGNPLGVLGAGRRLCLERLESGLGLTGVRVRFNEAAGDDVGRTPRAVPPAPTEPPADEPVPYTVTEEGAAVLDGEQLPEVFVEFQTAVLAVSSVDTGAACWIRYRPRLAEIAPALRARAWVALHEYLTTRCGVTNAKVRLKSAIARLGKLDNPPPPRGGHRPPANDAPADEDARERAAIASEPAADSAQARLLIAIQNLKDCDSSVHVARHFAAHVDELPAEVREQFREFAVGFLHGRYPRAVSSRGLAAALLEGAVADRAEKAA